MMRGGKTCWKAIRVHGPGRHELRELEAAERLAALYRFQTGEVPADHCFTRMVDGRSGVEVKDPAEIDWDTFPVLAALEAITRDELRRLRHILRADNDGGPPPIEEEPLAPTSSGTWALPVFGPMGAPAKSSATSSEG